MKPKPTEKGTSRPTPGNWQQMNRIQRREMMRKIRSGDIRLEVVHTDADGIDIGKETHYVTVPPTRDSQPVRRFGCTIAELKEMAVWLKQCAIRTVAIAYASHCTSLGRCETFWISCNLFDNLMPLAFRRGLAPGSS
jgi:hypothetical protein